MVCIANLTIDMPIQNELANVLFRYLRDGSQVHRTIACHCRRRDVSGFFVVAYYFNHLSSTNTGVF